MHTLGHLVRAILLGALFAVAATAADSRKNYDLPSAPAEQALKRFSEESGRETLFAADIIRGVRTAPVRGEYTAEEAIDLMLADTGLVAARDRKTGAFAVRRETQVEKNVESRQTDSLAAPVGRTEDGKLLLEKVEVTGSRIRSIVGEQGINPILTYTRAEIEQTGVASLADLRTLIPQLSVGNATAFDGNSGGSTPEGRLVFTLRGITGNNTLLLVDGRRLPRTGQRVGATENYELTGLPLSAIERVEVLLDGGSAVYGSDAIGGVINIITRKNYTGAEIEFAIDNTFDTDAALKRWSISASRRQGRFGVRASAAYEDQNALARRDRWWLASDDRRPLGGTDARSQIFVGGVVRAVSGTLPGTGGATVLRIPTNSDGRNLTIADFVNAGVPTDAERYDSGQTLNQTNEFFRSNYSFAADYTHRPWLKVTAGAAFSRYRSYGNSGPVSLSTAMNVAFPQVSTALPANYPGNPFGVPINVQKYVWELGSLDRRYQNDTYSAYLTLNGDLDFGWSYEGGIAWSKSDPIILDPSYQFSASLLGPAIQGANPPILLNNSLGFGSANPDGLLESFFLEGSNQDIPETWTYDVKANGRVLDWWGGEINAALGAELREEYVEFRREQFAAATEAAQPTGHRTVRAAFAEMAVPLVSARSEIPFVHRLETSFAVRHDSYAEFGEATKPRYGASYRPFKWLMFRGTYGEAFKVPTLSDLNRPTSRQTQNFTPSGTFSLFDTFRNEAVIGPVVNMTGGNPNLLPEEAVVRNAGIALESPFALFRGFSVSVDHWDTRLTNRVSSIGYQDRLAFRPDLFIREAPTAADVAAGRPGRIIEIDNRSINIAQFNTAGFDYSLRYNLRSRRLGDFDVRMTGTDTRKYESVTQPGGVPLVTTSPLSRPFRGTGSLDWMKYGFGAGVTAVYQEGFRSSVTSANSATGSTILWNARVSYNFENGTLHSQDSRVGRWLRGVRVNLAIMNALDAEPTLTATGTSSGAIDARLRRYVLSVRKSL